MIKKISVWGIGLILVVLGNSASLCLGQGTSSDLKPEIAINEGTLYGRVEIHLPVERAYTNPFDPDEVSVQGHFKGPDGVEVTVDGFYFQDFSISHRATDSWDHVTPQGDPLWEVRFAPVQPGKYTWWVTRKDSTGLASSTPAEIVVGDKSAGPGFIHVAPNHTNFEFSDKSAFYPIGLDLAWPSKEGLFDFDRWFASLSQNGGNATRVWLGPLAFTLERMKVPEGGMTFDPKTGYINEYLYPDLNERTDMGKNDPWGGLGRIDLANAWRVDYLIKTGRQDGVYMMFCLEGFNPLSKQMWPINPYNKINGGPLDSPKDFFSSPEAKSFFKRRLRYIIARYASSPQVLAWEFFNEVDDSPEYPKEASVSWHQEMAKYLKQIDPYQHMVTTSFAFSPDDPDKSAIYSIPEIDFSQTHCYDAPDSAATVTYIYAHRSQQWNKPHWIGEFGLDSAVQKRFKGSTQFTDPTGINLETGLWSGMASPGAGSVMTWYWENYIEPLNLWPLFKPVSLFAADIPWNKVQWKTLHTPQIHFLHPPASTQRQTLAIEPIQMNFAPAGSNRPQTFRIDAESGIITPNAGRISRVLHGIKNHPDLHNPTTFQFSCKEPGQFQVKVEDVSKYGGAKLEIYLDDKLSLSKDFSGMMGSAIGLYHGVYSIDVPSGEHTIRIDNDGPDWMFASYALTNYLPADLPLLNFYGMRGDDTEAVLYLANRDYTWFKIDRGVIPTPLQPVEITVPGLKPGKYEVELWTPSEGKMIRQEVDEADTSGLSLELPGITTDLAVKIALKSGTPSP